MASTPKEEDVRRVPCVLPLRPHQRFVGVLVVLVLFTSTASLLQHTLPALYGLENASHRFHAHVGYLSTFYAGLLSLITAFYTTQRANNANAFKHALFRCLLNIAYPALMVYGVPFICSPLIDSLWRWTGGVCMQHRHGRPPLLYKHVSSWWQCNQLPGGVSARGFHPNIFLLLGIHAVLTLREEHLVFVRRLINLKRDAVNRMLQAKTVDNSTNNDHLTSLPDSSAITGSNTFGELEGDKDLTEVMLFWTSFYFGMVIAIDIAITAFYFGTLLEKLVGTLLGFVCWWFTYVQWYPRPTIQRRPALPGNYHIYSPPTTLKN